MHVVFFVPQQFDRFVHFHLDVFRFTHFGEDAVEMVLTLADLVVERRKDGFLFVSLFFPLLVFLLQPTLHVDFFSTKKRIDL